MSGVGSPGFEPPVRGLHEVADVTIGHHVMATDDEGEHEMCFGDLGDVDDEEKIVINVGGTRHETLLTTLQSKSGTRLHHIASRHTGGKTKEYFFDRHPGVFTTVMDYYRSGELHVPLDVCGAVVKRELDFWGIDEYLIKPCCWTCYSSYIDNQRALADFNRSVKKEMEELSSIQHLTGWRRKQMKIWMLLDHPRSSKVALSYAVASFIFVLASICGFCLETLPQLHYQLNVTRSCGIGNQTKNMVIHHSSPFLEHLDYICTAFFTVELVVRILFAPKKLHFFQSPMNVIDIAALLPLYVQIILELNDRQSCLRTHRAVLETIFILRIIRIFRIFHLVKHYKALKILVHAIRASIQELLMLTIFLIIAMLVFATLIFYAERPDPKTGSGNPDFETIPVGFWWAIITMTTVGYGDVFPQTAIGKLIGGMCALWGVLLVALTIPVISNNFTLFYLHARTRDLFVQGPESMRQSPATVKEKPKDGFLANKKSKKYKMNSCKYSGETKKGFDQKALLIRVDSNSATEDGGIVMATQNSGSSIGDIKVAANNHMCKAPIANDEEDCDDNEESEI